MDDRFDVVCVHSNNVDAEATGLHTTASRSMSIKSDDSGCVRDDVLSQDVHRSRLGYGDDGPNNAQVMERSTFNQDASKTHKLWLRDDDRCDKTESNSLPRLPRSMHCDSHRTGRGQFPGRCMKFIQSTPTLESCDETRQMPEVHEQFRCIRESNTSSNAGEDGDLNDGRTNENGMDLAKQQMSLNIPRVVEESSKDGRTSPVRLLPRQHRHSGRNISSKQSWLLRLFESKMFDMSIAITYLFNSKEPGVQSYLGESRRGIYTNICYR